MTPGAGRGLAVWGVAAVLGACATTPGTGPVTPGERQRIGGAYTVVPETEWQRRSADGMQRWTVAGASLHQLRLYGDLASGDTLFPEAPAKRMPAYDGRGRAHEVAELLRASLSRMGAVEVQTSNLRPAPFGERDGFRLDLSFAAGSGLRYRGLAAGTGDDEGRLQLILYFGAREHHFPAYEETVERLIGSVRAVSEKGGKTD